MRLNEMLKDARIKSGMTLKQIADDIGVSISAICLYEKGRRKIPTSYIKYWALRGIKFNWEEIDLENK